MVSPLCLCVAAHKNSQTDFGTCLQNSLVAKDTHGETTIGSFSVSPVVDIFISYLNSWVSFIGLAQ